MTNTESAERRDGMSNQTHNDQVKDAGRKRRAYVRKLAALGWQGFSLAAIAIALSAYTIITIWSKWTVWAPHWPTYFIIFTPVIVTAAICYVLCATTWRESRSIPYVPPVAEQIAALPAEEILVRGSEQPAATSEELLRAAQEGPNSEAADLLMPVQH